MARLTEVGHYRGVVDDNAVNPSKEKRTPMWEMRVSVTHQFVPEADRAAWVEQGYEIPDDGFVDIVDQDIVTYVSAALVSRDKGLLAAHEAAMKITGWDGASFKALDQMEPGFSIQFSAEEDTYNGETRIRPNWIDPVGSPIGGGMRRTEVSELDALTAEFAGVLPSAKKTKPTRGGKKKAAAPAPAAAPPPPSASTATADFPNTRDDAWAFILDKTGGEEAGAIEMWSARVAAVAETSGRGEPDFTAEDWQTVCSGA